MPRGVQGRRKRLVSFLKAASYGLTGAQHLDLQAEGKEPVGRGPALTSPEVYQMAPVRLTHSTVLPGLPEKLPKCGGLSSHSQVPPR